MTVTYINALRFDTSAVMQMFPRFVTVASEATDMATGPIRDGIDMAAGIIISCSSVSQV